jgi:hypothetical protein
MDRNMTTRSSRGEGAVGREHTRTRSGNVRLADLASPLESANDADDADDPNAGTRDRSISPARERRYGAAVTARSASAGRSKPKRRRAVSFGQVLLVSSGLAGFAGTMLLLSGGDGTHQILVATQDLASGSAVDDRAVIVRDITIDDDVAGRLAVPADIADQKFVLGSPVEAGAPIPLTALRPADGSDQRSRLSLPLPVERAVGGTLAVGGRVHLIGVLRDQNTTFASFVAVDVEVTDVREEAGSDGLLSGGSSQYFITVALSPDDLLAVTTVLGAGSIEVAAAPAGGGIPDISRSAVATEAGVVVVPRETLVNAIESEGRGASPETAVAAAPTDTAPTDAAPTTTEGG